jgi:hypothetical protein
VDKYHEYIHGEVCSTVVYTQYNTDLFIFLTHACLYRHRLFITTACLSPPPVYHHRLFITTACLSPPPVYHHRLFITTAYLSPPILT